MQPQPRHRRLALEQIGDATKLTIHAAQYGDESEEVYAHEKHDVKILLITIVSKPSLFV